MSENKKAKITVKFFGFIIDVVKKPEIQVEIVEEYSVREFLEYLSQMFGERFRERIFTECGNIMDHVRVSIGKKMIEKDDYNKKLIKPGMSEEAIKLFVFSSQMGG